MKKEKIKSRVSQFGADFKDRFKADIQTEYKMGAQYVYLNTALLVIHDQEVAGEFKVYFSTNILSHPILQVHEAIFAKEFFGSDLVITHAHIVDPLSQQVITGNDEALTRLDEIRKLEARGLVEEMVKNQAVEQAKQPEIILPNDGKIIV